MNIHQLVNTKTRIAIAVLACAALITSGGVGAYALTVRADAARGEAAMAEQAKQVHADMKKVAVLPDTAQASSTAKTDSTPAAETPQSGPQATAAQPGQTKKTYTMTDGLTGQTTSYTEGCVTKRPGYPDKDCDARAGAASMPMPTEAKVPTFLESVEAGSNSFTYQCTRTETQIGVPSVWFNVSDARGGLIIKFRYEFNGDSPYSADNKRVTDTIYTTTSRYEPTAPYLKGNAQYYDNAMGWNFPTKPGLAYRVHVISPVEMTSEWRALWYDYATCTNEVH